MSVSTPEWYGELNNSERKATGVSARLSEAVEVLEAGLAWSPRRSEMYHVVPPSCLLEEVFCEVGKKSYISLFL